MQRPFPRLILAALAATLLVTTACLQPRAQIGDPLAALLEDAGSPASAAEFSALRDRIHELADEAVRLEKAGDQQRAQAKIEQARAAILTFEGSAEQREQLAAEYELLLTLLDDLIDPDRRAAADVFEVVLPPTPTDAELAAVEAARSIPNLQRYLSRLPKSARRRVAQQIAYFTRTDSGRRWFQRSLNRSAAYREQISQVLAGHEVPAELFGVALIESGFSERAVSHAGAAGMWQFMPATARDYGMAVDSWVDQRLDWVTATDAAARYLKGSLRLFNGDIELAVASYNTGPGNVRKAIRRGGSRDFWRLRLHPETMAYVPKWIAALIVYYNPRQYGFVVPSDAPQRFDAITIRGSVELAALAGAIGCPATELFALNHALVRKATPPDRPWTVRLPYGSRDKLLANLDSLMQSSSVVWVAHRLRKDETLGTVSRLYDVPVADLMNANQWLEGSLPKTGDVVMVPVKADNEKVLALVAAREKAAAEAAAKARQNKTTGRVTSHTPERAVKYTVRRRDTLSSIGQRFEVSLKDLRRWNTGRIGPRDRIKVGQTLIVHPAGDPEPVQRRHTVKPGDTLSKIAARYGVSINTLAAHNGIKTTTTIYPGTILKVPGGNSGSSGGAARTHTVTSGDTLSGIAKKYGVDYRSLAAYNNLKTSSVLRPGQQLKVPPTSWKPGQKTRTTYKVRSGDTLTSIAKRHHCSVADLEQWNKIKRSKPLRVGQVLVIYR